MHGSAASLTPDQARDLGRSPFVFEHNLCDSGAFTDVAIAQLIDKHPRQYIYALTMGDDPTRPSDNQLVPHAHLSGSELMSAVKNGHLWLNIKRVDDSDTEMRAIVKSLYASLHQQVPSFEPRETRATLLISSPSAIVYYHVDGAPSFLWHVRGQKRVWVYPALDERFVSRADLEDIHAGVKHEYVRYQSEFDADATVFDLVPGQVASWPQNAPHRITNAGVFNVSLSTEHYTDASRRRARLYRANRFFRRTLRVPVTSTRESGLASFGKVAVHKLGVMAGLEHLSMKQHASVDAPQS